MSALDLLLIVALVIGATGGYRLGFITRVVSWIGLAAGLVVAVRLLPWVVDQFHSGDQALIVGLGIGLLLIGASIGQAVGFMIGGRITPKRRSDAFSIVDRSLGTMAGFLGVVVLIWLVIPILVSSPGTLARQVTNSWVARTIDDALPPAPDALQTLRAAIGADAFPDVFDALTPTPSLGAPPEATGMTAAVSAAVARSTVKVEGNACAKVQDGSGFVVAPDVIATNAHVVAGERSTSIFRDDGRRFDGTVIAFDPSRDLALVQVSGFDRPALPVATSPSVGAIGGVFGHPGGEPLRIAPFRVARAITATGRDIYGGGRTEREVLELAARLRPGDSGSAVVDSNGTVVGVAFAISRDRDDVAYALAPSELRAVVARPTVPPTGTGPCLA